jgi:hypothetical protein
VSVGRLRGGELLAGVGGVVLFAALFLDWFGPVGESGWDALGWLVLAMAAAAIALAAWLVVATAVARPVTQVVTADVLTSVVSALAFVFVALRALVFQPGPNALVELRFGAWLGLAGALAMTVGAWWSLADERTDAPESAYSPPAPRPAPPPASS